MNLTKSVPIFLAVALALALVTSDASAVNFTQVEKDKLSAGKTVKKPLPKSGEKGFYGGTGYTIIDAPVDVIWAAINDWSAYPKIFPKTVSVKELSRKGNKSLVHLQMGHKLISVEYYMSIKRDIEKHVLSFSLVPNRPNDIEESRGYWRLFPQKNGRTLVAYVVATQIPMGIINLIKPELVAKIQRHLLGAPNEIKKWVEGPKGAKYRTMTAKK